MHISVRVNVTKRPNLLFFIYLGETISKNIFFQIPVMQINTHVVFDPVNEWILKQKWLTIKQH